MAKKKPVVEEIAVEKQEEMTLKELLLKAKEITTALDKGQREIDLTKEEILMTLNKAISLAVFIEAVQSDLAKKKR